MMRKRPNPTPCAVAGAIARVALVLFVSHVSICIAQTANQSRLRVTVQLKNGHFAVDRSQSTFKPSAVFKEKSRHHRDERARRSESEAETALIASVTDALYDDLDKYFAMTSQVYWWLLSNDQRRLDSEGRLNSPLSRLRNYTNTYANFKSDLQKTITAGGDQFVGQQQKAFQGITRQLIDDPIALETKTALILDFGSDDVFVDVSPFDANAGTIDFRVADPVSSSDYQVTLRDAGCGARLIADQAEIVKVLANLEGKLWRSIEIRSLLEDFYANLGYQATVTLSEARADQKTIQIEESPRIARVVFSCGQSDLCRDPQALDKALYILLPDPAFRSFIKKGRTFIDIAGTSGAPEFKTVSIADLIVSTKPGSCPEPYLNLFRLQTQQLQLAQVGLGVAQSVNVDRSAGGTTFVDLQVQKLTSSGAAGNKAPENVTQPATPQADAAGLINANQQAPEQLPGFTNIPQLPRKGVPAAGSGAASPGQNAAGQPGGAPRERKNFVGGGFDYRPGQGVRLFSLYQRSQLFSDQDSFSAKVGGNSGALASFNYFADYVLFGRLHRRLSIRLTGGSDIEASRQIAGFTVDERQTGGSARVELELFRDLHGVQLFFYAEGARKTIELIDDADESVSKSNLTTLDVGALYFHQTSESRHPRTVRMEPRLRIGLGASSSEPSFNVFSFRGNWHQKLPRLYELDFTGMLGFGSGDTPLFEQPSLGGAESVRGFRRDDAIGRTLIALQSEVWMPIPRLQAAGETLGSYLRRNVRLAGFVDVGYLARASFSDAGIRVGPGLGARIIRWPVVIKLDWAYGFGEGVSGGGHGRFYLSITSNLPF